MSKSENTQKRFPKTIGLIMPLSTMDDNHDTQHWAKVRECLSKSILRGYKIQMVSDINESKMITSAIINNLYYRNMDYSSQKEPMTN